MSDVKGVCDVCEYEDRSEAGLVVLKCEDGIFRCKHCRQRAEYGRVLYSFDDDVMPEVNGVYNPIKPILASGASL